MGVRFSFRLLNISKEELDKRISDKNMIDLMNNIIDSFQLTLSDDAKQQQKEALARLDDTSLIKHYPPLDWSNVASGNNKTNKMLEK